MTSVDRSWAARYQPDDVLHYTARRNMALKRQLCNRGLRQPQENQITVRSQTDSKPPMTRTLQGIALTRNRREFAQGDRIQFTAKTRACRFKSDIGPSSGSTASSQVKMDGAKERTITFDAAQCGLRSGYAVTAQFQGLTADRVLGEYGHEVHPNHHTRFAYASVFALGGREDLHHDVASE